MPGLGINPFDLQILLLGELLAEVHVLAVPILRSGRVGHHGQLRDASLHTRGDDGTEGCVDGGGTMVPSVGYAGEPEALLLGPQVASVQVKGLV